MLIAGENIKYNRDYRYLGKKGMFEHQAVAGASDE